MKIALVIGHSKESQGAVNKTYEMSEFVFNEDLANKIFSQWNDFSTEDEITIVYRRNGLRELPNEINALNPDMVVSLHANAFNGTTNGCEILYYHTSIKGKEIAQIFKDDILQLFKNTDRGLKPRTSEDRGGYLLRYTNAPAIICEPFFIDNDEEYLKAKELLDNGTLAKTYCESLQKSLAYLTNLI